MTKTERKILNKAAGKFARRDALARQLAAIDGELRAIKAEYMLAAGVWGVSEAMFRKACAAADEQEKAA